MSLFPSLVPEDNSSSGNNLDELQQGSLFHTVEYELNGIVNKISNIDTLDEAEIRNIIIRQHQMILNYDLFLMSDDTRRKALKLFTNKRFLKCFIEVIRLLDITPHEKTCINKLAYDYYILPDNDKETADLLYRLTTEVNGKEVIVLSSILGMSGAQILSMIRNSTFKVEKAVHRVNTYLIKCNIDLSVQDIINIYCYLFERFTYPFIYTMMESKPAGMTGLQNKKFDNISIALLEILNSLPSIDINKVLQDYAFTLNMVKNNTSVRFALKTASNYPRIITILKDVENKSGLIIP